MPTCHLAHPRQAASALRIFCIDCKFAPCRASADAACRRACAHHSDTRGTQPDHRKQRLLQLKSSVEDRAAPF